MSDNASTDDTAFMVQGYADMDKKEVRDELTNGGTLKGNSRIFPVVYFLIKYVAPLTIAVIFVTGLLG